MQLIQYFCAKNCKIYHSANRKVCAYAHGFRKRPGCALIGACALIGTNTVYGVNYICL